MSIIMYHLARVYCISFDGKFLQERFELNEEFQRIVVLKQMGNL